MSVIDFRFNKTQTQDTSIGDFTEQSVVFGVQKYNTAL